MHYRSGARLCLLVSMWSIENATVLRWIPYGDGVLSDAGSLCRNETGGILWLQANEKTSPLRWVSFPALTGQDTENVHRLHGKVRSVLKKLLVSRYTTLI